ncbi:MAG: recombination protein RecR, partial [Clostridiales bacterium]
MNIYIDSLSTLVAQLSKLPGVGKRTAFRYAYAIIGMQETDAEALANSILEAKKNIGYCSICGNFT